MEHRLAALVALALTLLPACTVLEPEEPLPREGFDVYTGTKWRQGDAWLGVTELTHAGSGVTVVLVPMIHIAETRFYREVQEILDGADVVLLEGIGGSRDLGPMKLLTTYVFANYPRYASHGGLAEQGEVLVPGGNARRGDMTMREFATQAPWYTPLVQLAFFPLLVVGGEVHNATAFAIGTVERALFLGDWFRAGYRHFLYSMILEPEDEPFAQGGDDGDAAMKETRDEAIDLLLPGVIDARNARLLEAIDAAAAEPGVRRIAVPWGSGHMPDLRERLEERGYVPSGHRWLLAVRAKGLRRDADEADDIAEPFDVYVPFAVHWRHLDGAASLALLFQSIAWERRASGDADVSLVWDLLFSWSGRPGDDAAGWQVLPSLFGRPLLFSWEREGDRRRVRFLGFGDVDWQSGGAAQEKSANSGA